MVDANRIGMLIITHTLSSLIANSRTSASSNDARLSHIKETNETPTTATNRSASIATWGFAVKADVRM